jgi:hypothetical protein
MCFNDAKKRKEKKKKFYVYIFNVFLVAWQVMMKEVGEIISEMEDNMNNPMKILQKFCESNFYKVIGKGDFEEMKR